MRVLLLDRWVLNPYSVGLASGLANAGADVRLGGPAASGLTAVSPVYPRAGVSGRRVTKLLDTAVAVPELGRLLRGFRPDIVHIQWPGRVDLLYARISKRVAQPALVFTAHNPVPRDETDHDYQVRQRALIGLADAVIAHGPRLSGQLKAAYPEVAAAVRTVEHGNYAHVCRPRPRAEARRALGLPAGVPVFAFIGQLRPRKGLETLLDGYALYLAGGGVGRLVVAGSATDPAYAQTLQQRARTLALGLDWLVERDHIPQETLDLVASAATQIVLPHTGASQSGSVIFAMTHGRCVVTTAVGELQRLVAGRGLLVRPRSVTELGAALSLADTEPDVCDALGEAARDYALRELSWQRIGRSTLAVYEELV